MILTLWGFGWPIGSDTIQGQSPLLTVQKSNRPKVVQLMKSQLNVRRVISKASAFGCLAFLTFLSTTENAISNEVKMQIESTPYGKTTDGQGVTLYTLTNSRGNTVQMIDYGAIVVSTQVK